MKTASNIINFPKLLFKIVRALVRQKAFMDKHLNPLLENYADSDLTASDIIKIKKYYGLAIPAILGEAFCILRGKALTRNERISLTYLGALTGLYDDFFDKLYTPEDRILELTKDPYTCTASNDHEELFIHFYKLALEHSSALERIKDAFIAVYEAQVQSQLQRNSNLSTDQIREITLVKGAVSTLFYRSAMANPLSESEETMLYQLGSLTQLENDIFDVYKDDQEDITTLVTTTNKIDHIRTLYVHIHRKIVELLKETEFPTKNKILFAQYVNLTLCRGYVCLDFLELNEARTNHLFSVKDYSRKDLICDMEKSKNIIKTFNYYAATDLSVLK